jgi:hypothetical protein
MIHLIKEVCISQLQIETMLDTPTKLSQLIKSKGKKAMPDDVKPEVQAKIMKYVNLMVKPDFISSSLMSTSVNDLVSAIKMLESQKPLIEELR